MDRWKSPEISVIYELTDKEWNDIVHNSNNNKITS